ncbi:ATP-binding protein [Rossellomorea marisflavi]|uniref:sensor histidine kinase n=1 Tax=Rossellomorea TaxID=2837508 RepID=UPI00064EB4AB|nr:ATP-binding protein [Rossellomorea marisflavi]VXB28627.1 Histidine kinase [Bacillus sp. 349Y]KMK92685.1 histidine kinase [Rossellomorea marisflavi]QHA37613.1 HAMP domain-containing protein [Rossellomorea marisflavi]TYO69603.1 sensor histidine kinase [Rossellomorea marisflavi]USK91470.1 HAMP domain-containing protein [Rossellomorea marisflavi]
MKITTKINLLTTAWMLCILVVINFVVYFLFVQNTVTMEEDVQFHKAKEIMKEVGGAPTTNDLDMALKKHLTEHSFIRIMGPGDELIHQVTNDSMLSSKIEGKFAENKEAKNHVIKNQRHEEQVLVVRVPFGNGERSLEIVERLEGLEARKETLKGILIACTVLAAVFSLLGGRWLANTIMRPISNMIKTMEEIETSGVPKTISIEKRENDELQTMAQTFNRMISRIQGNMAKQAQFVSDASHELKTPLTVIKSYANLLRRHGVENKEIADEAIQAIHSEATRIQKMTDTFLDLADLEKENVLEISQIDLVALSRSSIKQLQEVYHREISLHTDASRVIIPADELKIKQVIIILLDNAMKYSSDKIDVYIEKVGDLAVLRVKDYGIGIPKEEITNIFERFYRVDKARSRETGGTGLGLHIARSIMKLHLGEINIRSEEGKGTEVELVFVG